MHKLITMLSLNQLLLWEREQTDRHAGNRGIGHGFDVCCGLWSHLTMANIKLILAYFLTRFDINLLIVTRTRKIDCYICISLVSFTSTTVKWGTRKFNLIAINQLQSFVTTVLVVTLFAHNVEGHSLTWYSEITPCTIAIHLFEAITSSEANHKLKLSLSQYQDPCT